MLHRKNLFHKNVISIIIPFYNEEKTVSIIVNKVLKQKIPSWTKQIVLVNDGSTDNFNEDTIPSSITYIKHQKNEGMGNALRTGIANAYGEIILFQDADNEYDPSDIPLLIDQFKKSEIHVVYGSRYKDKKTHGYFFYYLATSFFTKMINILYNVKLTDAFTGYKVFRSEIFERIDSPYQDFRFNVDITTKILAKGIQIYEVPIRYIPRSFSEGKKISPLIGVFDFFIILRNLLLLHVK